MQVNVPVQQRREADLFPGFESRSVDQELAERNPFEWCMYRALTNRYALLGNVGQ